MAWALLSRPRGRGLIMPEQATVKPTLGLTGVTVNAMALIAPGAFLWITYQLQAAATAPDGSSVAGDIWAGIGFALILAFLTAISYAQLARLYPEAGFGSCYYFAEKAFLDRENQAHHKWARLAKLVTGWAAHLFYWVYPGCMVAFMATLIGYIYQQFTGATLSWTSLAIIAALFAALNGYIAMRGVNGSTMTALVINVIQLTTLVLFSCLAIYYRLNNPEHATGWAFSGGWDVVMPHSLTGVLIQSTLAILILVGFESCTAFAAETKDPKKNIPRAVILSLVIQGLFAYMFEYFAAGYMVSEKLAGTDASGAAVTGIAAAGASGAPTGALAILVGHSALGPTALWTLNAFGRRQEYSVVKPLVAPGLGLIANLAMLGAILYLYIIGNADSQHEAYICFAIAGAWAALSLIYVVVTSRRAGRAVFAAPTHA